MSANEEVGRERVTSWVVQSDVVAAQFFVAAQSAAVSDPSKESQLKASARSLHKADSEAGASLQDSRIPKAAIARCDCDQEFCLCRLCWAGEDRWSPNSWCVERGSLFVCSTAKCDARSEKVGPSG